jgi:fucose 4-O-acetylase-like acetyltransferase
MNGRDRTIDAFRAVAIVGVVLGHWLVSAVVGDPYQVSALHGESPLLYSRALAPFSWVLQTLGPFFFAGGYAASKSLARRPTGLWLRTRIARLVRPVLALAAVWVPALLMLAFVGAPSSTRHVVISLVSHPLWFLLAYVVLTLSAPLLRPVVARFGPWAVLPLVVLILVTDVRRSSGLSLGWVLVTVLAGWAVPYLLGMALAEDRLSGSALLPLGVLGGALLILVAHYPASAVGVPGDNFSNLDPPSLFALALAFAQIGLFLLVRPRLAGLLQRPGVWWPVSLLNLVAMTVFLWHQTALLLVTFGGLLIGRPPGLLDPPDGVWPLVRLLWLPVFALVLAGLTFAFHRFEARPSAPGLENVGGGRHHVEV